MGIDSIYPFQAHRTLSALGAYLFSSSYARVIRGVCRFYDKNCIPHESRLERACLHGGGEAMRIIFLPDIWTIILCFIVWPVLQVAAALFCLKLPDRFFQPGAFFYRTHRWERDGRLYDRTLRVRRWKHLLPDGGMVWKKHGYSKKRLEDCSEGNLKRFLIESARGEMTHWLAIFPFWLFGFFTPSPVPWMMLAYALVVNLPCIIVQRYSSACASFANEKNPVRNELYFDPK